MSINLTKGNSLNLTKKEPALQKIMIGLGWEMRPGQALDLDAAVFILGNNGKLLSESHLVFYNNLKSPDGAVQHTGDNRTGNADGDDEVILANLSTLIPSTEDLVFVVTIHESEARNHHFGLLQQAFIRLVDVETKREISRYDLDAEFSGFTEVEFAKLHKVNNEWLFTAVGIGTKQGLQGYVNKYL